MWLDGKNGSLLTDDGLYGVLKEGSDQIILIDGPSGCGKSRLIRRLCQEAGEAVLVLPEDRFVRSILTHIPDFCSETPFAELISGRAFVCLEDVDLMLGRSATQKEAAERISEAARSSLVILTGIRMHERIRTLIDALKGPVRSFEYISDEAEKDQ